MPIGSASGYATGIIARGPKGENLEVNILDGTYITEYHGKVPAKFFDEKPEDDGPLAPFTLEDIQDQKANPEAMVEAIIVIANGNALLKKTANPFPEGPWQRGFVAYQHDRVPNRFWGRGVCEKAYNSQLALDAELRGRIDAMALMTYPMVGFDATRLPRNLNLQIRPGKAFLTNGDPETIIRPISFDNLNPNWFQHSSDLERMVSLATGTFDPGSPSPSAPGSATASAASMSMGAMIKRAKLTMQTVDVDFLSPLIRKSYVAYQILDSKRYPANPSIDFEVNSSMSIMAREFEQTQMTNLLAIIPPQSPAFYIVLRAIAENYSGPSRTMLVNAVDQLMQPNPQQQQMQQMQQQLQMRGVMAEIKKLESEASRIASEIPVNQAKQRELMAKAQSEPFKAAMQQTQLQLEARKVGIQEKQSNLSHIDSMLGHVQHHKDHELDVVKTASDHALGMHQIAADREKAKAQAEAAKAKAKEPKNGD